MERTEQANLATPRTPRALHGRRPSISPRRRGVASLLAMLYMIIFSALALGFYAAVTTAVQLAHNEERALNAQVAAESGLAFVRYQLSRVRVPAMTPSNEMMQEVVKDLVAQQALSDNLAGRAITLTGNTIEFPAGAEEFIPLDAHGAGFRAELTDAGDGWIRVRVFGRYRGVLISRAVEMWFESVVSSTPVFDYGIVTRGPVNVRGNASVSSGSDAPIDASILSTTTSDTPFNVQGSVAVAGDLYMVNPTGNVATQGKVTIGDTKDASEWPGHIHSPAEEPEFPTVNSKVFLPYVKNAYVPGQSVYRNVLVPAGTNPVFNAGVRIEGVLYIKHPNQVTFSGGATVRGTIVVEGGARPGPENTMKFRGGFDQYGMETLVPPPSPDFPPDLIALRGSALLAPGYAISFGGNAGTVAGTLLADTFDFAGNSGGDIAGTIIAFGMGPLEIAGHAKIRRSPSTVPIPAGLEFSRTFRAMPETYLELRQ